MTKDKIKEGICDFGEEQLAAFKKFQDEEYDGMTVRDFDVWLGAYISAISRYYSAKIHQYNLKIATEEFESDLKDMANTISKDKTATALGITGVVKEEIRTFNFSEKK